jgi:hypothetical protein
VTGRGSYIRAAVATCQGKPVGPHAAQQRFAFRPLPQGPGGIAADYGRRGRALGLPPRQDEKPEVKQECKEPA